MRKLPVSAIAGVAALAIAVGALAAAPKSHVLTVPLPDGSVARVEYAGDVQPRVTVVPPVADAGALAMPLPPLAGFDRMIEEINRQTDAMLRQAQQAAREARPGGAAPYIASFGNVPAGATSTTVVSVSNGGAACTRTTEVVSQGAGKPPKVTTSLSGQCGGGAARPADGAVNRA